ncbi:UNVERIFIED_CONTAM: hypothetical protein GTU68_066016 [Idotea baltica]|nr:hypothetical protein [Idotea baltica]
MSVRPKHRAEKEPIEHYSGPYKSSSDYADALRTWMVQLYQVQCIHSSFPLFLANLQAQASQTASSSSTSSPSPAPSSTQTHQSTQPNQPQPQAQPRRQETPRQGLEYAVPPIWKRFGAEMIDFLLLFIIKLGITYIAVDTFDLLEDVDKYDFETLSTDILTDYRAALNMTSDLLFLELIHRIGTCVFEALCLHRGPRGLGGATPGKKMMGLRVVRCEFAAPALADRILVYPSYDLGIGRAIVRSVVKNLSLTFLFPICFTMFSFQHNRTIYDILAGSIVVEERPRFRQQ